MLTLSSLGYEEAQKAIEAGFAAAARFGRPMAFAIADANGDIIASARMDGAPSRVMRQTLRKVYTAANMARNTLTLKRDLEDRDNTMWDWGDPNFTTLQGGLVVKMNAASGGSAPDSPRTGMPGNKHSVPAADRSYWRGASVVFVRRNASTKRCARRFRSHRRAKCWCSRSSRGRTSATPS